MLWPQKTGRTILHLVARSLTLTSNLTNRTKTERPLTTPQVVIPRDLDQLGRRHNPFFRLTSDVRMDGPLLSTRSASGAIRVMTVMEHETRAG